MNFPPNHNKQFYTLSWQQLVVYVINVQIDLIFVYLRPVKIDVKIMFYIVLLFFNNIRYTGSRLQKWGLLKAMSFEITKIFVGN